MKPKAKVNLTIRVIEYGMEHGSFMLEEMQNELVINTMPEIEYLRNILAAKTLDPNPNNILGISEPKYYWNNNQMISTKESKYSLLPTAYFSYVDHLEIITARENAEVARKNAKEAHDQSIIANNQSREANTYSRKAVGLSMWALIVSGVIGVIQIILQIYYH